MYVGLHLQGQSEQKPMKNFGENIRRKAVPKISRAPIGALRGHLCDSAAFLFCFGNVTECRTVHVGDTVQRVLTLSCYA